MEKLHKDSIISIDKVTAQAKYIGAVSYDQGSVRISYKHGGYDRFHTSKEQYDKLVKDWKDSQSAVPEFDRLAKHAWKLLKAQIAFDVDTTVNALRGVGVPETDIQLIIVKIKN